MGNNESSPIRLTRTMSQSPTSVSRKPHDVGCSQKSNIVINETRMNRRSLRRSRTTRQKDRNYGRVVCPVTGLTLHQKALLARKWNRMDRGTIYEMGRRVFENVFNENPQYLAYIEIRKDDDEQQHWWNHINFKIHVQRFVTILIETMRRLKEPSTSIDILRDFGAIYAKYPKRVSAMFFEKIANAMNEAAEQLQEGDHLEVEKTKSRMEEATEVLSIENTSNFCTSCTSLSQQSNAKYPRPLMTRYSESQMSTLREDKSSFCSSCVNSRRSSHDCNGKSTCPITSEAWLVLSAFIANQIKFGYELEKLLICEMGKLGIDNRSQETQQHRVRFGDREPQSQFV